MIIIAINFIIKLVIMNIFARRVSCDDIIIITIQESYAGQMGSADTSTHPVKFLISNGHLLVKFSDFVSYVKESCFKNNYQHWNTARLVSELGSCLYLLVSAVGPCHHKMSRVQDVLPLLTEFYVKSLLKSFCAELPAVLVEISLWLS